MAELQVGNLSTDTTESQLAEVFEACGEVAEVQVLRDHSTGRSKGLALVIMPNPREASEAIRRLNKAEVGGRKISVKASQIRPERSKKDGHRHRQPKPRDF